MLLPLTPSLTKSSRQMRSRSCLATTKHRHSLTTSRARPLTALLMLIARRLTARRPDSMTKRHSETLAGLHVRWEFVAARARAKEARAWADRADEVRAFSDGS